MLCVEPGLSSYTEYFRLVSFVSRAMKAEITRNRCRMVDYGKNTTAVGDAKQREIENLRLELAHARGYVEALQTQVGARSGETEELREIALNLEQQLLER